MTTELLRLCSPGVGNEECPVVRNKLLLQLESARSIEVLGVVRDNCLRDRLTDSVHLRGVSTTLDTEANVDRREEILASNKDGLIDLEPQDFGLEERDGGAVDVDETTALFGVGDGGGSLGGHCKPDLQGS